MKRLKRSLLSLTAAGARLLMCGAVAGAERADIVLADFEGESFGAWRIAGTAFGQAPVPQRAGGNVSAGRVASSDRRLENGKSADASLHSPDFVVPRRYLNLELAGGDHAFRAAASLWVDGRVVRTSTGGNRSRPGWVT